LLAIVTVSPSSCHRISSLRNFPDAIEKKCKPHLSRALVRQTLEIPHDLAPARGCGAGRPQRIINLNN
jgi:hypothetical protein